MFYNAILFQKLFSKAISCLKQALSTIMDKIDEANCSFHVKALISIFQQFSASIKKSFSLGGRLGTRL